MKNIVFFITHKTLMSEHANATFYGMSKQVMRDDKMFDVLYIYNTHADELPNDVLLDMYNDYDLGRYFKEVRVFNYDNDTSKSLGGDVSAIRDYMIANYAPEDRYLMLKSDCVLSKNYFDEILHLPQDRPVYFVAPFICAKERISDTEIFEYSERDKVVFSDDITFFVEDQNHTEESDFKNRPGVNVTDYKIKFTSCYVIRDFSVHFLSVGLAHLMEIHIYTWGGLNFWRLVPWFIETDRCFVIHKYHGVISENRQTDREGPVLSWLKS